MFCSPVLAPDSNLLQRLASIKNQQYFPFNSNFKHPKILAPNSNQKHQKFSTKSQFVTMFSKYQKSSPGAHFLSPLFPPKSGTNSVYACTGS
jgi:hypothetical protein